jgi:hypothetical protein
LFTGIYPYLLTLKNHASLFKIKILNQNDENDSDDEPLPSKRRRLKIESTDEITIDLSDKK